jgi:hypothetical protein
MGAKDKSYLKGNDHGVTHGLYRKHYSEEEQKIFDDIKIGEVDEEIAVLKMQLRRAVKADEMWRAQQAELEEVERTEEEDTISYGSGAVKEKRTRKKRILRKDGFAEEIRKFAKAVVDAEAKRANIAALRDNQNTHEKTAQSFREFTDAVIDSFPGEVKINREYGDGDDDSGES